MKKKALVLIQGINNDNYLKKAMVASEYDFSAYSNIKLVQTENEFDKKKSFVHFIPFVGDSLSDVIVFYKDQVGRQAVCRKTRKLIKSLQADGYEVDLLCHSLGCQIALACGDELNPVKVNKTTFLASPLGIGLPPLRWKVFSHARKFSVNFSTASLFYAWSRKDFVSRKYNTETYEFLQLRSHTPIINYETGTSHNALDYLDSIS